MTLRRIVWMVCAVISCAHLTLAWAYDVAAVENVSSLREEFSVDGRQREVLYLYPTVASGSKPPPAIVLLHYLNGTPAPMADLTGVARLVRDYGVWVVLPQALSGKWNASSTYVKYVNDVRYLDEVIAHAKARGVDARRIYMGGYSGGAFMTALYACRRPQLIAAGLMVGGSLYHLDADLCDPTLGTPMLMINGTDDPLTAYGGNLLLQSVQDTAAFWARSNGCGGFSGTELPDIIDDGTRVHLRAYPNCTQGQAVELYTVSGGGHTWPGAVDFSPSLGVTSHDINATSLMWAFFQRFSRQP
ncbi:hypothetical protein E4T66_04595 [Sinimarinibacterium sp. CAU 1509]|uniref:alpha/beta hydrolase family esterase n=1 Tax=Sinimarinibacterium sp. CAU 1509 TaxID=2562283 RepID=UPI0010AB7639|nr:PHB depolymerase family esterase [Sinimarinibacterium sp. CAU 1509]TJY62996.1 hypothetical protein E4T66_04595 [Sinimarinibacterium sp. CAU 1509]